MTTIQQTITEPAEALPASSPTQGAGHGPIGWFNAWFFDSFDPYLNFVAGPHKRAAFADIPAGRILEIGAGTGANFAYLPAGSQLVALEPNPAMHDRLRRRADERSVELEVVMAGAESIPLEDASVDTVLCSLVLCTVTDPEVVLGEIRRVLRPGGTFRFVEHVSASPTSPRAWLQRLMNRPWSWVFEGCQLCRDTASAISRAGFQSVDITERRFRRSVFVPVNSAIHGCATK